MTIRDRAKRLGWEYKQVTGPGKHKFYLRRIGWATHGGPPSDLHIVYGWKEVEAFLDAVENGESTERWR